MASKKTKELMMGRSNIYYWKSDRAFAAGNTRNAPDSSIAGLVTQVSNYLHRYFKKGPLYITPAHGQGNHVTLIARYTDCNYFIRLENGPEGDNYMAVESTIMEMVKKQGIPCPSIYLTDVSRTAVPFAIQVMELIDGYDLNHFIRKGQPDTEQIAFDIGRNIGYWQAITLENFGPFNVDVLTAGHGLFGYHTRYRDYYFLNLEKHLDFLVQTAFLTPAKQQYIMKLIADHESLLHIDRGCLVHKDLAFWNILSDGQNILAFIDWDDAISVDPVDYLSLLACFHTGSLISAAIKGYTTVRPLPDHFEERFWLHLLRNMIFKAVIRVRGNYFDMPDSFFMNNGQKSNLKKITLERITAACRGLSGGQKISNL